MSKVDWAEVERKQLESMQALVGKQIKSVAAYKGSLSMTFEDGTELEVSCYVEQREFCDVAELSYDLDLPKGEPA